MRDDDLPPGLRDNATRVALVDYYKWIVNIAVFVFTISVSFVGLHSGDLQYRWLFRTGWILLSLCIFFNLLLIKRFVTLPVVLATPGVDRGVLHRIFLATLRNMQVYGTLQNACLLLGTLGVSLGFVLNWMGE